MKGIIVFIITAILGIFVIAYLHAIENDENDISEIRARPKVEYTAEGFRDPFQGYYEEKKEEKAPDVQSEGQVSVSPPSLTIQGMVWGGDIHQAIVNNKVVREGDTVEEAKIMKIEKNGITVLYRGQLFNLSSPNIATLQNLPNSEQSEGGKYETRPY